MDLSRDALIEVLIKHGYPTMRVTPEWLAFAVQLLIAESLDKNG